MTTKAATGYLVQWVDPKTRVLSQKRYTHPEVAGETARALHGTGALMVSIMHGGKTVWEPDARGPEYQLGKMTRDEKTGIVTQHAPNPRKRGKAQNLAIAMSEQRAGHPRKAKEFFERAAKSNPKKKALPLGLVEVWHVDDYGAKVKWLSSFAKASDAETFGRAYADKHDVRVMLNKKP